jgi:hypothetical protein
MSFYYNACRKTELTLKKKMMCDNVTGWEIKSVLRRRVGGLGNRLVNDFDSLVMLAYLRVNFELCEESGWTRLVKRVSKVTA